MQARLAQTHFQVRLMVLGLALAALGLALWQAALRGLPPVLGTQRPLVQIGIAGLYLGGVSFALGLGAYLFAPVLRGPEAAARDYGSHRAVLGSVVLGIVLTNLIGTPLYALLSLRMQTPAGFVLAALLTDIPLLAILYFRWVRPGLVSARTLGLARPDVVRLIALGVVAYPLAVSAVAAVDLALRGLGVPQTQMEQLRWLRHARLEEFLGVLAMGTLVAPPVEEAFFRGFVFRAYLDHKGPLTAYLVSSALFALLHLNLQAFAPIFVLGIMLAGLCHLSGSIIPGAVVHALNNGTALLVLYFGPTI